MKHANDNNIGLRFLSVCSGIEAASVAWHPLGWRAVAFAEIEKFPSAVLAHHYPDVPNLGDFTKISTKTLGRVDILAGGTPCQAFSVAGLRKGLDDARGNLTLKFVELAHELADGNGLRNVVWENVVGVLSDKGNAFGCFLAGLVGADTAIDPPSRGKWPTHGMVAGPKGRAAWAVKDAQYFGVAQRRRRVLVVADFGNGADPAAVLFEPESVCRNSPPSREAGKGVAPTISARTKGGGGLGTDFDLDGGLIEAAHPLLAKGNSSHDATKETYVPDIARCVATREGSSQDYETTTMVAVGVPDVAGTMKACAQSGGFSNSADHAAAGYMVAVQAVGVTGQTTHALTAEGADASEDGTGRGTSVVCIHADSIGRTGEAVTPSADAAGVVRLRNPGMGIVDDGTSYNLMASGQPHAVLAFDTTQITSKANRSAPKNGEPCHPLNAQAHPPAIAFQSSQSGVRVGDVHATLDSNNGSRRHNGAIHGSAVRRLTPRECERLQSFQWLCSPDYPGAWQDEAGRWWTPDYTDIPWRNSHISPDGPRYKALGNSWAVPKFVWLGKRITALMPPIATNDNQPQSSPAADKRSHA